MLLQQAESLFLLVDVQEKLTHLVNHANELVNRCEWLLRLCNERQVPIIVSEQYPKGIGATIAPLNAYINKANLVEKVCFSAYHEPAFVSLLKTQNKKQVIIAGIETHVCVLQTAMDLQEAGFEVFVVVDAVSSRSEMDHKFALKRMKQNGIHLVTAEMVFFEWIRCAGTPEFKALSQSFLR